MTDVRHLLAPLAIESVHEQHRVNPKAFTYSMGTNRMQWVHAPGKLPVTCDCSSYVTMIYYMAGAPDPNGLNFDGQGYTGTLLSNKANRHINKADVLPGDLVVYGGGTGEHVAIITEVMPNGDLVSISMGQNGDPSYVWVNAPKGDRKAMAIDGRTPQTFLRCLTDRLRPPVAFHY